MLLDTARPLQKAKDQTRTEAAGVVSHPLYRVQWRHRRTAGFQRGRCPAFIVASGRILLCQAPAALTAEPLQQFQILEGVNFGVEFSVDAKAKCLAVGPPRSVAIPEVVVGG